MAEQRSKTATTDAAAPQAARPKRKARLGVVVSDKMDKTVVVRVEDVHQHRLYHKLIRRTTRLKAHDEQNEAHVGDTVRLMETRPLSATKRWRVVEIVQKAK
jgi:small subunit ribosomal protein S17